ncbi:hypothetical protein WJX81_000715 [Elliptochloris bilobata]|uniref:Methyltransferase type 11 domain-containing protein n=1 Tax=Elliptochloris bilobata TaxID=381761 RepID=A0AAW1SDF0_9CHLO
MTTQYAGLFKNQAARYAQFRPTYPEALYTKIFDFARLPQKELAVDVATGTGQAAAVLGETFEKVIAQDSEKEQLKQATPAANVVYQQAPAEAMGVPSGSVDLVTVAQALHWFDLRAFYTEVRRVLRPTGALAIWGYDLCTLAGNEAANAALKDLYDGELGPCWASRRRLVEQEYAGMEPATGFGVVERTQVHMTKEMSIEELTGYVESWSAYASFRSKHPDAADPVEAFRAALLAAYDASSAQHVVEVVWP